MKRLPIPQFEFAFAASTFGLFCDSSLDGERLARERDQLQAKRRASAAAQRALSIKARAPKKHPLKAKRNALRHA